MQDKIKKVENLIDEIYRVLDVEITERNIDTPHRIAKFWCNEVFAPKNIEDLDKKMKLFPNPVPLEGTPSPVICEMEFSSYCFTGKTSILTPKGCKYISDITVGDDVLTFDNEGKVVAKKVIETSSHKVTDLVQIDFSDGKSIKCTPNHPIFSVDYGDFISAQELKIGNRVYTVRNYKGYTNPNRKPISKINYDFSQEEIYVANIVKLHSNGEPYTVYNFEVEDLHTYIANGIYVHNCEHHLLPFFGKCKIEYTPTEQILGLSKFNRIVNYFSEQPQTQENLTRDICMYVKRITKGKNVKVTLYDTTHTCVECRGVRGKSNTTTTYFID